MAKNQTEMFIEDGSFSIDNSETETETMRLHGKYQFRIIRNKALPEDYYDLENIRNQAVFVFGNVLIRSTTEEIEQLIDVFIRYTHDPCKDLELDLINENKQMRWGTICPTKKTLFKYKSKVFVAYGRYIFGYDKWFAEFRRVSGFQKENNDSNDEENSCSEDEEDDDGCKKDDKITQDNIILKNPDDEPGSNEYVYAFCIYDEEDDDGCKKDDKITQDNIILKNPDDEPGSNEYVYAFCIYDEKSGVLDAFGLYR